jgi:hypothetical protein
VPTFDPQLWRSRAAARLEKGIAAGKATAPATYARDIHAIDRLVVMVDWCTKKRLMVTFRNQSGAQYERDKKLITVNGRLAPEKQLHVLMHECGHHLIGIPSPEERFGQGYQQADNADLKRTTLHRIDVLDEELEAWARGLKLAKRLHIAVDIDRYNRTRSEYIKTYLLWAAKVEGWTGSLNEDNDG